LKKDQLKHLFDRHFEEIRRYLFYRSGDEALSTDLAQEVFIRIWEKRMKILPGKEKALLYKIAGDFFVSNYRKKNTEFRFMQNFEYELESPSPDQEMEYEELARKYTAALEKLEEKQRVVFLMHRNQGLTYKEIAQRLNIGQKAVEKRMHHALNHFRRTLKDSEY